MSTMKVLICQEIKNLVWEVRERPVPGDNEALIKIKTVGICGTDIHAGRAISHFSVIHAF